MKYGYLIELEYISGTKFKREGFDQSPAKEIAEAEAQLNRYENDLRIQQIAKRVTLKKLVVIYKGWELVYTDGI